MPLKLDFGLGFGPVVKPKIMAMIKEFRDNCYSISCKDLYRRFGSDRPEIKESTSATVSVSELLEFFDANPGCNMVRIYFAAHDTNTIDDLGYEYRGQVTSILVPAIATYSSSGALISIDDQLNDDPEQGLVNSVSMTLMVGGQGDDQYPLCPPNCPPGTHF